MKRTIAALTAPLLIAFVALAATAHPQDFRDIVAEAGPAIVNIQTVRTTDPEAIADIEGHRDIPDLLERFFGRDEGGPPMFDTQSIGSGFLISEDGLVVTNHHVVDGADEIRVRLNDRREFTATIVGSDLATDIALLRIRGRGLPVVRIGASETVAVGDWVVAIGSPFNFENTVTAGILSARGRSFPQQQYVPFLQTDVPINRGNSGGPLLDLEGRVIGVNSQIFSESGTYMGLSFSIPIEIAMAVVDQLRLDGVVDRGLLGVGIEDVTLDLASALGLEQARGAIVTTVSPGSAADAAGIRPWDVILAVDEAPIERFSDLPPLVGLLRPGTPATITVSRAGALQRINVVIGSVGPPVSGEAQEAAPFDEGSRDRPPRLGLRLEAEEGGLRVVAIDWDAAWRAGIRRGDLLRAVNREPTVDLDAFDRAIEGAATGPVALLVQRGGLSTFVVLAATEATP